MAEVLFRAKLQRTDSSTPWGFRLQGGVEYNKPLTLLKVVADSLAAKGGLHAGDIVVKLCGKSAEGMTHKDAQHAILNSGNSLEIIVERAEATLSPPTSSPASPPLPVPTGNGDVTARVNDQNATSNDQSHHQNHIETPVQNASAKPDPKPVSSEESSSKSSSSNSSSGSLQNSESQPGTVPEVRANDLNSISENSVPVEETVEQHSKTAPTQSTVDQKKEKEEEKQELKPELPEVKNDIPTQQKQEVTSPSTSTNDVVPTTTTTTTTKSTSQGSTSSEPSKQESDSAQSSDVKGERLLTSANEKKATAQTPTTTNSPKSQTVKVPPSSTDATNSNQKVQTSENRPSSSSSPASETSDKVNTEPKLPPDTGQKQGETSKEKHVDDEDEENNNSENGGDKGRRGSRPGFIEDPLALLKAPDPWPAASEVILKPVKKTKEKTKEEQELTEAQAKQRELLLKQKEQLELQEYQVKQGILQKQKEKEQEEDGEALPSTTPPHAAQPQQQDSVHPWRKARPPSDRKSVAATDETDSKPPSGEPVPGNSREGMTPTLTFVGSRIESPAGSPVSKGYYTYTPESVHQVPSIHIVAHTSPAAFSQPTAAPTGEPVQPQIYFEEYPSPRSEDIFFSTADPDLVGIPMPAVKEMVADLNRRLEAIAEQHPKIAQPATPQELGLSFAKPAASSDNKEREIFIDTRPVTIDEFKQRFFGVSDPPGMNSYQKLYDITSPVTSPFASAYERTFSYPGDKSPRGQRRVTFADPVESSVIEIEPRARRPRRGERRRESPELEMESPSSLTEKLDRIERENALAASAMRIPISHETKRSEIPVTHERRGVQPEPRTIIYGAPPPYREDIYIPRQETPPRRGLLLSTPSGRGFSVSLGQGGPERISFSIQRQKGDQPTNPPQMAFSFPSKQPAQQITYSISPRAAESSAPMSFSYSIPSSQRGPSPIPPTHGYTKSWDDSKTIHITYPPQPVQPRSINTAAGPLSPPQGSPVPYNMVGVRPYSQTMGPMRSLSPPVVGMRSLSPPIITGRSVSPPAGLGLSRPVQVNRAPSPTHRTYTPSYTPSPAQLAAAARGATPTLEDMSQSKSFKVLEAKMSDGGKGSVASPRVSVDVHTARVAPHTVPQPVASARRFDPVSPGPVPVGFDTSLPPTVRVTQHRQPIIPQVPQELLSNPAMDRLSASGLFAFFDKSFTDKFLQWQTEQAGDVPTQSETYKLVREMDEDEKRYGGT